MISVIEEELYDQCMTWISEELSSMDRKDRMNLYGDYEWMFSSGCKMPDLESLIKGNDPRVMSFRKKFKEWFLVVCRYSLNPTHLGQTSYSHYLKDPHWKGSKAKGNKVYPQRVILALGMMGIFTGVKSNYLYLNDKRQDHGRVYFVDITKLKEWISTPTPSSNFSEPTFTSQPEETWTFSVSGSTDSDFDYSFLEGDDEASRQSWSNYEDWFSTRQQDTISSISVLPEYYEQAQQFLTSYTYKMFDLLTDKKRQKDARGLYRNCKWLVKLNDGKVGACKEDDKGGRFYSMMVGLGREFRRECLRLDGERIVEVDVSSSQPTLIGLKVKKETGQTTEWLQHCLKGDFYEWAKKLTGVEVKRQRVKEYVMRYLYSCYGAELPKDYEGEHIPPESKNHKTGYKKFEQRLTSYLKDNEPEIYRLIDRHKRQPNWNDKVWTDRRGRRRQGKWCSSLPVEMQRVEVEFIQGCLSRLPETLKFYTIHDAICVKESEGQLVKNVMEQVSRELYGETISVKIENSSPGNAK